MLKGSRTRNTGNVSAHIRSVDDVYERKELIMAALRNTIAVSNSIESFSDAYSVAHGKLCKALGHASLADVYQLTGSLTEDDIYFLEMLTGPHAQTILAAKLAKLK